jgi:hypothetical protein
MPINTGIIYNMYGRYKVFIDGRSDMYKHEVLEAYFKVFEFQQGWGKVLGKYSINYMLIRSDCAFTRFLAEWSEWPPIHSDSIANIYVRIIPENLRLIEKYKGVTPYPHDFFKWAETEDLY